MATVLKIPVTLSKGKTYTFTLANPKSTVTDSDCYDFFVAVQKVYKNLNGDTISDYEGGSYLYKTESEFLPDNGI